MREIKFRAWDKEQKYMAYQGTPDLETLSSFVFHFGDEILMQYTGLKDKNGKEIYEGDILLIKEKRANFPLKWVVVYNEEQTGFRLRWEQRFTNNEGGFYDILISPNECEQFEIIGNIYEHPELLEKELTSAN
jgi:uncharacterized phage protein (TIGR01671 family)